MEVLQTSALDHLATSPGIFGALGLSALASYQHPVRLFCFLVPRAGLEPARPCEHSALNAACLPIPTPRPDTYSGGFNVWQGRRDSNPRPSVLETDALAN
jgi:hypothetical protein